MSVVKECSKMSAVKSSLISEASANSPRQFPSISLTRQGTMFLVVSLILLLTAINYSNHNILLVALFLLSLFAVSLLNAVRYIIGVALSLSDVRSIFMGQEAQLFINVNLSNFSDPLTAQIDVVFETKGSISRDCSVAAEQTSTTTVVFKPVRRGRYCIKGLEMTTAFPFGLFRVRRQYAATRTFWVYPKPADDLQSTSGSETNKSGNEAGESIALRQYRLGDPVRRIHKKSLAMGQRILGQSILVKDVEAQAPNSQWLQWDRLQDLETERRLRVLTRQVLDEHQQGNAYGLSLPKIMINPASGEIHKHKCLRALAEY